MKPKDFYHTLQRKVAIIAAGPSAMRNQGEGVLKATQDFLSTVSLARIPKSNAKRFHIWLDRQTTKLLDSLPITNRPWGTARKAINLFLREALYNKYLNEQHKLDHIEAWLEMPLDSVVALALKRQFGRGMLPRWSGLKDLDRETSDMFQDAASELAQSKGLQPVHLDMYLWISNR